MNFCGWNIRGIGGGGKSSTTRKLVAVKNLSILGLVETKHSNLNQHKLRRFWGGRDHSWCDSSAVEGRGGLILIWDKETFDVKKTIPREVHLGGGVSY